MKQALLLIPVPLNENADTVYACQYPILNSINVFIVENIREARRNLRRIGFSGDFNSCIFYEWDKHRTENNSIREWLKHCEHEMVGLLSDAGCPAVADPGADIVAMAHSLNIPVKPLIGPSSILLALMGSGLNGQSFAFNGYLPVNSKERRDKLKQLEHRSFNEQQTQIFIETPYRNQALYADMIACLQESTMLCIAYNLTSSTQQIITDRISGWRKRKMPEGKAPAVFLLLKQCN